MPQNPFIVDRPVPPRELIDREEEVRLLVELAEGGHNARLSAPRRYGKTTLLRRVATDAEGLGMQTVFVDFFGVLSAGDVAGRIEEAYRRDLQGAVGRWFAGMVRTLRPRIGPGAGGTGVELGPEPELQTERLLTRLLDLPVGLYERTGRRALVVFDEFQSLLAAGEGIDGLLRSRIQYHLEQASYVFAGSHPGLMDELFSTRDRPLYGQARAVRLAPLEDLPLAEYIGERFEGTARRVGSALEPLLELVRGHPQRAMLVAHHLWERTARGATADEGTWAAAIDAVFEGLGESFELTWDASTPNQRRGLAAVAWIGPHGGGESLYGRDTLARFKLSAGTARDVRSALLRRGDLEEPREGRVRLVDPLLEAWIASGRRPLR